MSITPEEMKTRLLGSYYEDIDRQDYDSWFEGLKENRVNGGRIPYRDKDKGKRVFKADALEALGLANHPKADLLFNKCWDQGQAEGYYEVWKLLQEWGELLDFWKKFY